MKTCVALCLIDIEESWIGDVVNNKVASNVNRRRQIYFCSDDTKPTNYNNAYLVSDLRVLAFDGGGGGGGVATLLAVRN